MAEPEPTPELVAPAPPQPHPFQQREQEKAAANIPVPTPSPTAPSLGASEQPIQAPTPSKSDHPFQKLLQQRERENAAGWSTDEAPNQLRKYLPWIILAGGVAVIIIGLLLYSVTRNKADIIVKEVDPSQVSITLNGKAVVGKNGQDGIVITTYPGQYRLIVTKKDYEPFVQDLLVASKQALIIRPIFTLLAKGAEDGEKQPITSIDYVRVSADGKYLFFVGDQRRNLYRMSVGERIPRKVSARPLTRIQSVEWSTTPDVALLFQEDGTYLQEIPLFDFTNQTSVKVAGSEIEGAAWDPSDPQRLAIAYNSASGEKSLIFSNRTFDQLDRKADLSQFTKPALYWTNDNQYIVIRNQGSASTDKTLWIYHAADSSLTKLSNESGYTNVVLNTDGTALIAQRGSTHEIISIPEGTRISVNLPADISTVTWRSPTSFFVPDTQRRKLVLFRTDGSKEELGFTFSNPEAVKGMQYFKNEKVIIFYTNQAIYTVSVGI